MKRSVSVFLILSVLSLAATLLPKYIDRNKLLQGLKGVRSEQKQESKRGLSDSNYRNNSMLPFMRGQTEEIKRLKGSLDSESVAILDSVSEIVKEMIAVCSEYENAVVKVFAALEFNTINDPEDLGKSIERAKHAETAANKLVRLNNDMVAKLKESHIGSRVISSDTDSTMQGFFRAADIERIGKLYKLSAEIMKDVQSALLVMEKEWGEWEYNEEGGSVLFESESAVIEFNDTIVQIGIILQKAEELQLTILKAQKGDSS